MIGSGRGEITEDNTEIHYYKGHIVNNYFKICTLINWKRNAQIPTYVKFSKTDSRCYKNTEQLNDRWWHWSSNKNLHTKIISGYDGFISEFHRNIKEDLAPITPQTL